MTLQHKTTELYNQVMHNLAHFYADKLDIDDRYRKFNKIELEEKLKLMFLVTDTLSSIEIRSLHGAICNAQQFAQDVESGYMDEFRASETLNKIPELGEDRSEFKYFVMRYFKDHNLRIELGSAEQLIHATLHDFFQKYKNNVSYEEPNSENAFSNSGIMFGPTGRGNIGNYIIYCKNESILTGLLMKIDSMIRERCPNIPPLQNTIEIENVAQTEEVQDTERKGSINDEKRTKLLELVDEIYTRLGGKPSFIFHIPSIVVGMVLGNYIKGEKVVNYWNKGIESVSGFVNSKVIDKVKPHLIANQSKSAAVNLFQSTMSVVILASALQGIVRFASELKEEKAFSTRIKNAFKAASDIFIDGAVTSSTISLTGLAVSAAGITSIAAPIGVAIAGGVIGYGITKKVREKFGYFTEKVTNGTNTQLFNHNR
ncbi:MAG: hypothetical protein ACK4OM_05530 [Alphaproteobacteria bacterium]